MDRAYTTFEIKRVAEEAREVVGIASTPEVDLVGDVIEPAGAVYALPIALLFHHDAQQPIGQVTDVAVSKDGIAIKAKLAKIDEPGTLRSRVDEAWQSIRAGLIRGLSIGFVGLETERIDTGVRFKRWRWLELSCVTVPANMSASISAIKSLDAVARGEADNGRRWESCLHEAAHVTIAVHFRLDVTKAVVDKPGSGLAFLGSHLQRNTDGYLTAVLAGGIAALGMSHGDRASVQRVAGLDSERVRRAKCMAEWLVDKHMPAIREVAAHLLKHGSIYGYEVAEVLERHKTPERRETGGRVVGVSTLRRGRHGSARVVRL